MDSMGWHDRLKARARELGLTDAEVARRLDLSQARYSSYANGRREPDFRTLLRICDILLITPDRLFTARPEGSENLRMTAAISALRSLNPETLEIAVALLDTLTKVPGPGRDGVETRRRVSARTGAPKARRGA